MNRKVYFMMQMPETHQVGKAGGVNMENISDRLDIQQATVEDAAEILALQKLAYLSEARRYNDYTIPPLTQTIGELTADFGRKIFLKAMESGRIVGSVNGFLERDRCHVGRLMVHPDSQGRGLGTRLMEAIEAWFADARSWELFTGELSVENIRLYERLGYREVRREQFPDFQFAVVFMSKSLSHSPRESARERSIITSTTS